jgi:hypothetical protein
LQDFFAGFYTGYGIMKKRSTCFFAQITSANGKREIKKMLKSQKVKIKIPKKEKYIRKTP